jgi:ATP-dependent Clp protease ATP-binding subunit ClpC
MFNRFSNSAKQSMNLARQEAQRSSHDYLAPEHMLLGLIHDGKCSAAAILTEMGIDLAELRAATKQAVRRGKPVGPAGQIPFTLDAKKALELAMEEAGRLRHNYIGTMHLLLGLSSEGASIAAQALGGAGVTLEKLRERATTLVDPESDEISPLRHASTSETAPRDEVRRLLHRAEELLDALAEDELADQVSSVRMRLDSSQRNEVSEVLRLLTSARVALEKRGESAAARVVAAAILQIAKQR